MGQDRPNQPRGDERIHYWTGFKHYIMSFDNMGNAIIPSMTKIFNGCRPALSAATIENDVLGMSIQLRNPHVIEQVYHASDAFYADLYAQLYQYRSTDG